MKPNIKPCQSKDKANGSKRISGLSEGRYVIREIETLEGHVKTDEVIVIEINEQYVVPDQMPRLVNYPISKTGTRLETPYLWIGVGLLALATAAGFLLLKNRRRKKE